MAARSRTPGLLKTYFFWLSARLIQPKSYCKKAKLKILVEMGAIFLDSRPDWNHYVSHSARHVAFFFDSFCSKLA
jgi:hypothetical protein